MFKEERKSLQFDWSHLGDIEWGRPHLGPQTTVAVYRLMQFSLRDALIFHTDVAMANRIFYDAGQSAGRAIYGHLLQDTHDFDEFIAKLRETWKTLLIGILQVESSDLRKHHFVLSVAEDLDCSGLPISDESVCTFDEGFIAALFSAHFGKQFTARETDCWCTGDRVCRFEVMPAEV
ncbi:MAG: 4-vinyl reductase [Desulfobulbaceae bacterium]|nr:4-vinyl reductase [Desulfobulbaceae bacterium]HIJ89952.1 4-vinyl reductase [Deltaproteobacteria bacterium]